jgi:hypothetical protein
MLTFLYQFLMSFWLTRKYEKLVLTGGTAFPGCARLTCFLDTGWKACATNLKNFSEQFLMGRWPTHKA